jgi:septal ring factor EnvC (AmiA/AmiB activator)
MDDPSIDHKLTQLLKIVAETNAMVSKQGDRLDSFEGRLNNLETRWDTIEHRLDRLEIRLDAIEHRLDAIEHRLDAIEHRLDDHDHRFEALEQRLDRLEKEQNRRFDGLETDLRVLIRRQDKSAGRIDALEAAVEDWRGRAR